MNEAMQLKTESLSLRIVIWGGGTMTSSTTWRSLHTQCYVTVPSRVRRRSITYLSLEQCHEENKK